MIAVGVVDVGSPAANNIGWAIIRPGMPVETGVDLDQFIISMIVTCSLFPAAIGFEAPMYVPFRTEATDVLKKRLGEGSRAWSAGAGASVTTAGLAVVPYALSGLKSGMPNAHGTTNFTSLPTQPGQVLFFEAFVTASGKGRDHREDALQAASALVDRISGGQAISSDLSAEPAFSLIGAAMLRTGWMADLEELKRPCLVVRPSDHAPLARS